METGRFRSIFLGFIGVLLSTVSLSRISTALPTLYVQAEEHSSPASDIFLGQVGFEIDESPSPISATPDYQCIQHSGTFMTVAHTHRGIVPLITWQSNYFGSQWTPESRCKAVSNRFQLFSRHNMLQFISTGELNRYPIICVSEEYGDCLHNGLLLTLEPSDNPNQVLKELFDLSSTITRGQNKSVVDIEYILEEKNILGSNTSLDNPDSIIELYD